MIRLRTTTTCQEPTIKEVWQTWHCICTWLPSTALGYLEICRKVLRQRCGAAEHHGQGGDRCAHGVTLLLAVKGSVTLQVQWQPPVSGFLQSYFNSDYLLVDDHLTMGLCDLTEQTSWNIYLYVSYAFMVSCIPNLLI